MTTQDSEYVASLDTGKKLDLPQGAAEQRVQSGSGPNRSDIEQEGATKMSLFIQL